MTKISTTAAFVLGAGSLLALAGCGDKKADTSTTTTTTAATDARTTAAAPAAAPAADANATPVAMPAVAPAAADSATPIVYTAYQAKADAVHGKSVFVQCQACHVIDAGQNRVGPSLHAVVGRHSGQEPNFAYSAANKNSGIVWTEEVLFKYLENPRGYVPGTKMSFVGLKNPQDRADVIAYLKQSAA